MPVDLTADELAALQRVLSRPTAEADCGRVDRSTLVHKLLSALADALPGVLEGSSDGSDASFVQIPAYAVPMLAVLSDVGSVQEVVYDLCARVRDGVTRPGSWERPWLHQAFGDGWESRLEPDPEASWRERIRLDDAIERGVTIPEWATDRHDAIVCRECEADRGYGTGTDAERREAVATLLHNADCSHEPRKDRPQ